MSINGYLDAPATSLEELRASLRAWAKGDRGYMAAVEFLIACPHLLRLGDPLTPYDPDGRRHWLDFDALHHVDLSGGTAATWLLAQSMVQGLIGKEAWRLDAERRAAFVYALAGGLGVPVTPADAVPRGEIPSTGPLTQAADQIV